MTSLFSRSTTGIQQVRFSLISSPLRADKADQMQSQWAMIAKIFGSATHTAFPVPRPPPLPLSLRRRRPRQCATAPHQGALGITLLRPATRARKLRISSASVSRNCTSGTRTLAVTVRAYGSAIRCAWRADHPKSNMRLAQQNAVMKNLSSTLASARRVITC